MNVNLSEAFPIVDHQLSNATMCVGIMISALVCIPSKLVIVRRTIAIRGSALPLWKKDARKGRQQPLRIVPLSSVFCIGNNVRGVKPSWCVVTIVKSRRSKELYCH